MRPREVKSETACGLKHKAWCPHLLLAIKCAVPDIVSPALAKRGDCSRQRTWYQWVRGSVGAVESHTVILFRETQHILETNFRLTKHLNSSLIAKYLKSFKIINSLIRVIIQVSLKSICKICIKKTNNGNLISGSTKVFVKIRQYE